MAVLILMVKHPGGTMAIRPSKNWKFHDFTNYFRGRLTQPHFGSLNFKYDISSYDNCDLNNDDDWENLILLTEMLEKRIVDVRCVLNNNRPIDDHGSVVEALIQHQDDNIQENHANRNETYRFRGDGEDCNEAVSGCDVNSRMKSRRAAVLSSENLIVYPVSGEHNKIVLEGCNNESRKNTPINATTGEKQIVSVYQVDVSGGEEHNVVVSGCCKTGSCMKLQTDSPRQKDVSHIQRGVEGNIVEACNNESRKKPRITESTNENPVDSDHQKDVSPSQNDVDEHNVVVSEGCNNESRKEPRITESTSENPVDSAQQKDVYPPQNDVDEQDVVVLEGCNNESCKKPRITESTSENPVDSAQQKDVSPPQNDVGEQNVVVSGGCNIESCMKPCSTVTPSEYPNVICLQEDGEKRNEVESSEKTTSENEIVSLQQKMFLCYRLAEWENNITHIGQEFDGGVDEFRTKLVQYAAALGFHYDYVRNDGRYITAACGDKKTVGCKWYVNGAQNAATRSFILKKGDLKHTCTLSMKSGMKRMGAHVIADMIQESVRLDPTICPSKVKKDLLDHYGFNFHYSQVWRGVEVARVNIFGTYQDSCDELRWCSEAIKKTNPGSEVFLEFHPETRKFTRFFVAFKACIEGFKCCRPMLFVDGTFMETRYKGTILSATAKDGNNGLFPVAFAIADQENESNWTWFIEKLRDTLHHEQEVMYVSNSAGGLMSAFNQVFEKPLHFFCLYHLMKNLHTVYKGRAYTDFFRNRMCELLKEVAYAPNVTLHEIAVEKFKNKGGEIAEHFLMYLPYEKWTVASNPNVLRYGELTSDANESFNDWILQAKCLPVTHMIDCIRTQIMGWYVDRREICSKWTGTLTPKMEEQWNLDSELSSSWMIIKAPSGDYEVLSSPPVTVDLNAHTCSCSKWQVQGFPCCHAIAVINRECTNIAGFVDPCYFLSTYKLCYQFDISPVPIAEKFEFKDLRSEDSTVLPPVMKRSRGQGRKKTVVAKVTEDEQEKRFLCGRCGKYGNGNHYWTTCEEAIE